MRRRRPDMTCQARPDIPRSGTARCDTTGSDTTRSGTTRSDTSQSGTPRSDAARSGTIRSSAARCRGDHGSSDALGIALIAPAALGLAIVILFLGRNVDSRATVQVAAETGAQAAAQERTVGAAISAGTSAARAMLVDEATCVSPRVEVDTMKFEPGGSVSVTVSCTVSTKGLELINPGNGDTLSATAIATIDPLRGAESAAP